MPIKVKVEVEINIDAGSEQGMTRIPGAVATRDKGWRDGKNYAPPPADPAHPAHRIPQISYPRFSIRPTYLYRAIVHGRQCLSSVFKSLLCCPYPLSRISVTPFRFPNIPPSPHISPHLPRIPRITRIRIPDGKWRLRSRLRSTSRYI